MATKSAKKEIPPPGLEMQARLVQRQAYEINFSTFTSLPEHETAVPSPRTHVGIGFDCFWAIKLPGSE